MTPPDNRPLYKSDEGYRRAMEVYDWGLSQLSVPYSTQWVTTPHGLTHVLCAGDDNAPPVMLWHGMDASAPTWMNQINGMAGEFRLYAPDVLGSMGKSAPGRLNRDTKAYGDWMSAVMDGLGVSRAHHAGISNGGWLILKLANVAPEKIASAFLMSSAGFINPRWQLILRMLPVLLTTPPAQRGNGFLKVMGAPGIKPAEQDVLMFDVLMKHFHYEQSPSALPDDALRCLSAPTYLLMGEHEAAFTPTAVINRATALLPKLVKAEILSGVGHGMITENPDAVNNRIRDFFRQFPI